MRIASLLLLLSAMTAVHITASAADESKPLTLKLRSRVPEKNAGEQNGFRIVSKEEKWDPKKTAIVVCDMWDDHWCQGAARRVGELAGPMNAMLKKARAEGVLIIHAPSTTVDFYKDTPMRKLAKDAPLSKTPIPLSQVERWGTAWLYPDKEREGTFPIDDSDMGCDCATKCKIAGPWKRQIPSIDMAAGDAITDNGQEIWNLLQEKKIDNVILCGVHLNMCVLGRPFAIRQMVKLGKHVALMRDMTDTMYNHEMPPRVNHFQGTDLVVEHIEKYWCPSFVSSDITGGKAFRFKEDERK